LAVAACNQLGLPLKVVGLGKMDEKLREIAGPTIELVGDVTDQELKDLYANATALIYPSEDEDFGMVPVEAMGYGTPVIAHRSGGPKETIVEGKTGVFFDQLTAISLTGALKKFNKAEFDPQKIHRHAQQFDHKVFAKGIDGAISQLKPDLLTTSIHIDII
jgi:glycosyltransferase involved in cell wall biosynthesis